jgi:Spy/CpxP family protein refolding chaperone
MREINGLSLFKIADCGKDDNMKIDCMKKTIAVLAVLTFGCTVAFAAPAPDSNSPVHRSRGTAAPRPARDFLQQLSEKLNLTDEQKAAIKPILATEANEIKAVHQDKSLTNEQKQAKLKEIRDSSREKINAQLTDEQKKIFAEMKDPAGSRTREQSQNRLTVIAEKLNLTDEQKAAINPILATEVNDIKAVMQDNSLSKEQKQTKTSDIREASDKKINALLTPEQQAKWAQLKENAKQERNKKNAPGK